MRNRHRMKLAWYEIRWSVGILDEKQLIAIGKFRSESNGNGSRCRPPMANHFKSPDIDYCVPRGCEAIFEVSDDGPFVPTEPDARCSSCGAERGGEWLADPVFPQDAQGTGLGKNCEQPRG